MTTISEKEIRQEFRNINDRIDSITGVSSPEYFGQQISELSENLGRMHEKLQHVDNKIEDMKKLNTPLVDYSDDELREAWKQSDIPLKVIADKFKVEISNASRMVNGHILDKNRRNELMRMFLDAKNA